MSVWRSVSELRRWNTAGSSGSLELKEGIVCFDVLEDGCRPGKGEMFFDIIMNGVSGVNACTCVRGKPSVSVCARDGSEHDADVTIYF